MSSVGYGYTTLNADKVVSVLYSAFQQIKIKEAVSDGIKSIELSVSCGIYDHIHIVDLYVGKIISNHPNSKLTIDNKLYDRYGYCVVSDNEVQYRFTYSLKIQQIIRNAIECKLTEVNVIIDKNSEHNICLITFKIYDLAMISTDTLILTRNTIISNFGYQIKIPSIIPGNIIAYSILERNSRYSEENQLKIMKAINNNESYVAIYQSTKLGKQFDSVSHVINLDSGMICVNSCNITRLTFNGLLDLGTI
jgi:hypothetical protein